MADIRDLLKTFGSPLYVYQLDAVELACSHLRSVLPDASILYYSLKANPHPVVVRKLRLAGCRAEVCSVGELDAALEAGFSGADCLYTGPGKTAAEIDYAIGRGVRRFSAESADEMDRLGRAALDAGVEANVLLRINFDASGASALRMTGAATQFGADEAVVMADPKRFSAVPGTRLSGLHLFPISNARDEENLIAAFRAGISLARRLHDRAGLPVDIVDLGGGFAAPYARPGVRPDYPRLRAELQAALDADLPEWRTGKIEIAFESGRYLVGDCGRLAATVQDVKQSQGQTFVILDAGINHLGGMAGLGRLARAAATPETAGEDGLPMTLTGPLCTPVDVLGREIRLPAVAPGEVVVFPNVGAYGLTASLIAFLGRPAPAEIVLDGSRVAGATRMRLSRESASLTSMGEQFA